jgi:basic membrane protein A and related proteins
MTFKNHLSVRIMLIVVLATAAFGIFAAAPAHAQDATRVTFVVNGTLGDKSYFDSAQRGLEKAEKDFGYTLKTIELGEDATKWESGLEDAISDTKNYDMLIVQGYDMAQYLMARADNYADKKFILFDEPVDFTKCKCANVYNVVYAQNEASYLGGLYAVAMLKSGKLANTSGKLSIAAVGGQDVPVIQDFIAGYTQGAKSVDASANVIVQFIGGDNPWGDPAKGKEIGLALYEQGADFVFGIAGGSGQGIIEAAKEKTKYTIGVDSDQASIIKDTDPKAAAQILTSVMKNVDNSLYRALSLFKDGKLAFGTTETVGLAEGGVGLAKNEIYDAATPDEVKKLVDQAEADIIACKIKVDTALQPRECVPSEATADAMADATAEATTAP